MLKLMEWRLDSPRCLYPVAGTTAPVGSQQQPWPLWTTWLALLLFAVPAAPGQWNLVHPLLMLAVSCVCCHIMVSQHCVRSLQHVSG